ncbi:hypothetical protein ANN_03045 [Periplaneta americana]|uniref:Uncharacterized protein n=1 Tax=Periplaneta americana TaxID=6978 RepID=A0ABQ8U0I8_PERAM|nr:hypothetical protein ANN_03045 [Periplaneta americana]
MGESRNAYRVLVGTSRGKRLWGLGRPRRKWGGIILKWMDGWMDGYPTNGRGDNAGEMSPGSSTESYPAFARIGLRENSGKNLNQVTCPNRDSNPGHLVSQPDALTVTPQMKLYLTGLNTYLSSSDSM